MRKAFVETTVLTNVLLKRSSKLGRESRAALTQYDETQLPVYAIKEFKAGPLRYYVWIHNKLAITGSFARTWDALHAISRTPQRYLTSTALEVLREAALGIKRRFPTLGAMLAVYGSAADPDVVQADQYRDAIKTDIYLAWRRRRKVVSIVVCPLDCYQEAAPTQKFGLIELNPTKCNPPRECCLAIALRSRTLEVFKLREAIRNEPTKPENIRRMQALKDMARKNTANREFSEKQCRDLGDAYFALFAPDDAVILTTNVKDIKPLAGALGKKVNAPEPVE